MLRLWCPGTSAPNIADGLWAHIEFCCHLHYHFPAFCASLAVAAVHVDLDRIRFCQQRPRFEARRSFIRFRAEAVGALALAHGDGTVWGERRDKFMLGICACHDTKIVMDASTPSLPTL